MPLANTHNNYADLIGYWRAADGGVSNLVLDESPTQANGTINGATWEAANDTIFEWQFDYTNTPKQVDYVVSALEHLCIPVNPAWNLDGSVFGTSCSTTVGVNEDQSLDGFSILAKPNQELIEIITDNSTVFNLIDQQGKAVFTDQVNVGRSTFSTSEISAGVYLGQLIFSDGTTAESKLVIH
jgi:hypothetical protein